MLSDERRRRCQHANDLLIRYHIDFMIVSYEQAERSRAAQLYTVLLIRTPQSEYGELTSHGYDTIAILWV